MYPSPHEYLRASMRRNAKNTVLLRKQPSMIILMRLCHYFKINDECVGKLHKYIDCIQCMIYQAANSWIMDSIGSVYVMYQLIY